MKSFIVVMYKVKNCCARWKTRRRSRDANTINHMIASLAGVNDESSPAHGSYTYFALYTHKQRNSDYLYASP